EGDALLRRDREAEFHPGARPADQPRPPARERVHQGLAGVQKPMRCSPLGVGFLVLLATVSAAGAALAQERPTEEELFGGAQPPPAPPAPSAPAQPESRDEELLGHPGAVPKRSESAAPENPLTIGG